MQAHAVNGSLVFFSEKVRLHTQPSTTTIMSFRGARGMAFVRGESSDQSEKGEKYMWREVPDARAAAMRGLKRAKDEDDYFDEDEADAPGAGGAAQEEEEDPLEAYMRELEGKPAPAKKAKPAAAPRPPPLEPRPPPHQEEEQEEEEEDPLDAYMKGLTNQPAAAPAASGKSNLAQCDEPEDHVAEFMERRQKQRSLASSGAAGDSDDAELDSDGDAADKETTGGGSGPRRQLKDQKGKFDLLAPVDHDQIEYPQFNRAFYAEASDVSGLSEEEVAVRRRSLNLRCSGFDVPRPISRFEQAGLSRELMAAVRKHGYDQPTPIQCQALPVALSGRDMIGIAATGSGKTAAFVLPMLTHVMDQPELQRGDGPIGLVLAPTHELAEQIVKEARRFAKILGVRCTAVFGGVGKYEQFKELKAGAEVVVGTPGRVLELIKTKGGLSMGRVTYVVIDEADRMFSLGFEPQVRSIVGQVRPDRQTLLFSATFKPNLERLARDVLREPVRVTMGEAGDANEDVTQVVEVLQSEALKWGWLTQRLAHFLQQGTVLIFVSTKSAAEELARNLSAHTPHRVDAIHGDRTQAERQEILHRFKRGSTPILVATDVASRGLDIPAIKTVVNFDVAKRIEDHTHRIGRTGRAGATDGTAYTLVTPAESDASVDLVRSLLTARQQAPPDLIELATKSRRWPTSGLAVAVGSGRRCAGGGPSAVSSLAGQHPDVVQTQGDSTNVFARPQLFQAERARHAVQAARASGMPDPKTLAMACAARLSAQSASSSSAHAFTGGTQSVRTPAASTPSAEVPAPPAVLPAQLAAAHALAAKLSAGFSAMTQPPQQRAPPPPPPRPSRWS